MKLYKKIQLICPSTFSFLLSLLMFAFLGCGIMAKDSEESTLFQKQTEEEEQDVSAAELQQDVQRFTGVFLDRINQSILVLTEKNPEWENVLMRQYLLYSSSAVDIATGQNPEANLLDMWTLVDLSKDRVKSHWIPNVLGKDGIDLLKAFQKSEREIVEIASKVMSQEQKSNFRNILSEWKRENSELILVERVRLTEVSKVEGVAYGERVKEVEGLLNSLESAVETADEGVILANRVMFLTQYFPTLMRLQARYGTQQVLSDSLSTLAGADETLAQMQQEVDPLLDDMIVLTKEAGGTTREVKDLIRVFRENFPQKQEESSQPQMSTEEKLEDYKAILEKLKFLTVELRDTSKSAESLIQTTGKQADGIIWTAALAVLLVLAGFSVFWWGGYYFAKRNLRA